MGTLWKRVPIDAIRRNLLERVNNTGEGQQIGDLEIAGLRGQ